MNSFLKFSLIFFVPWATTANESCIALLEHGFSNVRLSTTDYKYKAALSENFCKKNYEAYRDDEKQELEVLAKALYIDFGDSSSSQRTAHSSFCQNRNLNIDISKEDIFYERTIYDEAIKAWDNCNSLHQKELFFEPSISPDKTKVSFSIRYTGEAESIRMNGISTSHFECKSGGKKLSAKSKATLSPSDYSIDCLRRPERRNIGGNSSDYYYADRISIATGDGKFIMDFAEMVDSPVKDRLNAIEHAISKLNVRVSEIGTGECRSFGRKKESTHVAYQCSDDEYLRRIDFSHAFGQDYTYQETVNVTCCKVHP